MNIGRIVQVSGPVVDVEFPDALPAINNALTVDFSVEQQTFKLTLEVQQQLGDKWVRTVSMSSTEGLRPPVPYPSRLGRGTDYAATSLSFVWSGL